MDKAQEISFTDYLNVVSVWIMLLQVQLRSSFTVQKTIKNIFKCFPSSVVGIL
jgi:hypothetical protein